MLTGVVINNHNSNNLETIDVIIEATVVAVVNVVAAIATRRPRRPSLRRRVVTSRPIPRRSIRRDRLHPPTTIVAKGEEATAVVEAVAAVVTRSAKRERSLCVLRRVLSINPHCRLQFVPRTQPLKCTPIKYNFNSRTTTAMIDFMRRPK
jgi:hypothetical protein